VLSLVDRALEFCTADNKNTNIANFVYPRKLTSITHSYLGWIFYVCRHVYRVKLLNCTSPIEVRKIYNLLNLYFITRSSWRDLEIWVWGRSMSLKMAPFDTDHIYDFLLVRHCKYSSILYHFRVIWSYNIMTLKSRLGVTQGHHSKACVKIN